MFQSVEGPYQKEAGEVYSILRENVVNNVLKQYAR